MKFTGGYSRFCIFNPIEIINSETHLFQIFLIGYSERDSNSGSRIPMIFRNFLEENKFSPVIN